VDHRGQLADLHKFCDGQKDWKVRWILKDPGFTAANLDRPGIQRVLELVQGGRVDVVVVWRYDRLSRDNLDFPLLLHEFRKHNVEIMSATEPAPGTDTPYGEFIVGMSAVEWVFGRGRAARVAPRASGPERRRREAADA
jgi:site-specific DNA recombinase